MSIFYNPTKLKGFGMWFVVTQLVKTFGKYTIKQILLQNHHKKETSITSDKQKIIDNLKDEITNMKIQHQKRHFKIQRNPNHFKNKRQ